MKKISFILLLSLLSPVASFSEDCWKDVYVQEIIIYSNPTPFHEDRYSEKTEKGEKKTIQISCKVYDSVSVGDYLQDKDQTVSGFNFFNKKKRFLEKKKYLILEKK